MIKEIYSSNTGKKKKVIINSTLHLTQSIEYTAAWYKGNLKEEVDEALEAGSDLPHSDAYTINGEPGDFCACSNSMSQTLSSHFF